jgi:hypothetical protein
MEHGFKDDIDKADDDKVNLGEAVITACHGGTGDDADAEEMGAVKQESEDDEEMGAEESAEKCDDENPEEEAVASEEEAADAGENPEEEEEEVVEEEEGGQTEDIPLTHAHLYNGIAYDDEVLPTTEPELLELYKHHDSACRRVRFHMREMGFANTSLNHKDAVRGGVTEKAQELVRLVHTGALDDVLDYCFRMEGVLFADAAEQRLGGFENRQRKHRGKGGKGGKGHGAQAALGGGRLELEPQQ